MKRFGMALLAYCTMTLSSTAQVGVEIRSQNKAIWVDEGRLEEKAHEFYRQKYAVIKSRLHDELKRNFYGNFGQATRAELVLPSDFPVVTVAVENGCIFLKYRLSNTIKFRITTPDVVLGIGKSREDDPKVHIEYDAIASFQLRFGGSVQLLQFAAPSWQTKLKYFSSDLKVYTNDIRKGEVEAWFQWHFKHVLSTVYFELDPLYHFLNEYLDKHIKANPKLLAELQIDENNQLTPIVKGPLQLVFQHNHSTAGMAKRAAKKEAGTVLNEWKAPLPPSTIPASTSPAGMNARPAAATPTKGSRFPKNR